MEYRDFKLTPCAFEEAVMENPNSEDVLDVLNALIDCEGQSLTSKQISVIKDYMSGKNTFDRFATLLSAHDSSTTCGSLWDSNCMAYRCRTCSIFSCMSLCSTCFENGNHEGHDFNMFKSYLGGACDCGCVDVMKPSGFCPSHGPNRLCLSPPPTEITCCAKLILPRFLKAILHLFRLYVTCFELQQNDQFERRFVLYFDFLKEICELGSVARSIIAEAMLDPAEYQDAVLTESSVAKNFQAFVDDQMSTVVHPLLSPFVSQEFSGYKTMIDEYVFCCIQAGLPTLVLNFLLNLLPVDEFKSAFFISFINHYMLITKILMKSRDTSLINRVAHLTIQLFSTATLVNKGTEECNLISIVLNSMWVLLIKNEHNLISSGLNSATSANLVIDRNSSIIRSNMFWPSISDFIILLFHEKFALDFASEKLFFNFWLYIITYFQGMNAHVKHFGEHLAYETHSFLEPFASELEICCSVCWSLFVHLKDPEHVPIIRNIIDWTRSHLSRWIDEIDFSIDDSSHDHKISFHIPLHRYLSCFLYLAIQKHKVSLLDFHFSEKELLSMLAFPLRIHAGFYEIMCGIWVRNGSYLRNQAFNYIDSKLTCSTCDTDLFLIKCVASVLDKDVFLDIFFRKFFVTDWLSCSNRRINFCCVDQNQLTFMLEGSLVLLAQIMAIKPNLDSMDYELLRQEVVTILSVYDLSFSLIEKLLPRPYCPNLTMPSIEKILNEVAVFSAPFSNKDYGIQEGKYKPNDIIWETSYDPLHVLLRSFKRKELQESIDRFKNYVSTKLGFEKVSSLWPAFKLPHHCLDPLIKVRMILQSKKLHKVLFMILYNYLNDNITSDRILQLAVYLLELAVDMFTFPTADREEMKSKVIRASEVCHKKKNQGAKCNICCESSSCVCGSVHSDNNDIFNSTSAKRYHLDNDSVQSSSSEIPCCECPSCICSPRSDSAYELGIKKGVRFRDVYEQEQVSSLEAVSSCCTSRSCICDRSSNLETNVCCNEPSCICSATFGSCISNDEASSSCICTPSNISQTCCRVYAQKSAQEKNDVSEEEITVPSPCPLCKYIICKCDVEMVNYESKSSGAKSNVTYVKSPETGVNFQEACQMKEIDKSLGLLETADFYKYDNVLYNFHCVIPTIYYDECELITDEVRDCGPEQLTYSVSNSCMLYTSTVAIQAEKSDTNLCYREESKYKAKSTSKRMMRAVGVQTYSRIVCKQKTINESMLTLLLKILMRSVDSRDLGRVLSKTKSLPTRRIGDDAYFISLVVNKFCSLCNGCEKARDEFCNGRREAENIQKPLKLSAEAMRKQKAKARQKKIINLFASYRKEFMNKVLTTPASEEILHFKSEGICCCICRSFSTANSDQTMGLIGMMQLTNLPGLQKCIPYRLFGDSKDKFSELNSDLARNFKEERNEDSYDFMWSASRFYSLISADLKSIQKKYEIFCSSMWWNRCLSFQSCEHYIHLDCYKSYLHSLQLSRVSSFELEISELSFEEGEFSCPICRRKSNFVIPLLNYANSFWCEDDANSSKDFKNKIQLALSSDVACQSQLNESSPSLISSFLDSVFMLIPLQFNSYTRCDLAPAYFASLIRMQLECDFISNPATDNYHNREFILNLFRVIYFSSKHYPCDYENKMWQNLTSVGVVDSESFVYPAILLHDPVMLMVRLLILIPLPMPEAVFTYFIHIIFNFVLIQKLVGIMIQSDMHESNQWHYNRFASYDFLRITDTVMCCLKKYGFMPYPREKTDHLNVLSYDGLCESVFCACYHFVRIACLLKLYLFPEKQILEIPEHVSIDSFWHLCEFLCITPRIRIISSLFNWYSMNDADMIEFWIKQLGSILHDKELPMYNCLTACEFVKKPRLVPLPQQYCDLLKMAKFTCSYCAHHFEDVSFCLICGRIYPSRSSNCCNCMKQKTRKHSGNCGAGTQVMLFINSTLVAVCTRRQMGIWGSIYLDEHGEEDREFKRGKPLTLNLERYHFLQEQWRNMSFDSVISRWISAFPFLDSTDP